MDMGNNISVMLLVIAAFLLYGLASCGAEESSIPVEISIPTPPITTELEQKTEPFEPDSLSFYTVNDWYLGAKIVVRNSHGKSVVGYMPINSLSLATWDRGIERLNLPSPGRLTEGFTVTVSSRYGTWTRFYTTATGDPRYDSRVSIYLYITGCPNAYLWPKMFVNWAEVEVYPSDREAPENCGY
jgi:hypothetical protein